MKLSKRNRRGGNAIEFALCMPVLIMILTGIMDYGWFFTQQHSVLAATRVGARTGSTASATESPAVLAKTATEAALTNSGFSGYTVTTGITGVAPDQVVTVSASVPFTELVGMVPKPDAIIASLTMRLEDQG